VRAGATGGAAREPEGAADMLLIKPLRSRRPR
jgi:hypothetical protein